MLRVTLVMGGLPRPQVQIEVRSAEGLLIARIDLGYEEVHLGLEFDGPGHELTRLADSRRENELARHQWQILRFTGADLRLPVSLVRQVAAVLALRQRCAA